MTTRKQVLSLAAKLGATVEIIPLRDGTSEVLVMAKRGHHYRQLDVHEVVCSDGCGDRMAARWAAAWDDLHTEDGGPVFEQCTPKTCQAWESGRCGWWNDSDDNEPDESDMNGPSNAERLERDSRTDMDR